MKSKKQTLIETLQKLKGEADFVLVAETIQEANVKSRITKLSTPANLEVVTKFTMAKVRLGANYSDAVNKQREAEGLTPDFVAGPTYAESLNRLETGLKALCIGVVEKVFGFTLKPALSQFVYRHKVKEQMYLRVYPNLCLEYVSESLFFDKEGNDITAQWKDLQAEYFKMPSKSSGKQGTEKTVLVNNYKIENVKYLGDGIINELTEEHIKMIDRLSK